MPAEVVENVTDDSAVAAIEDAAGVTVMEVQAVAGPTPSEGPSSSSTNVGVIVGPVLGGLAAITAVAILIVLFV